MPVDATPSPAAAADAFCERETLAASAPLPDAVLAALKALRKAAFDSGKAHDKPGDGPDSAAAFRDATKVIAAALARAHAAGADHVKLDALRDALDFFDRVGAASEAERIAVGTDHWNRLEAAARAVAAASAAAPAGDLGQIVHDLAKEYEHRDPDHTPTDAERAMLEDFGNALLERLDAARPAPAPPAGLAPSGLDEERVAVENARRITLRWLERVYGKAEDAPAAGVGALVDALIREVRDHEATMWFAGKRDLATAADDEYAARTALLSAIAAKDREIAALRRDPGAGVVRDLRKVMFGDITPISAEEKRLYALRAVDSLDCEMLIHMLPDSGHGRFWQAVARDLRDVILAETAATMARIEAEGRPGRAGGEGA